MSLFFFFEDFSSCHFLFIRQVASIWDTRYHLYDSFFPLVSLGGGLLPAQKATDHTLLPLIVDEF
jgi:hypothetical protein